MSVRDFFDFWEVRREEQIEERLSFEDNALKNISESGNNVVGLRVVKNGRQAFLSAAEESELDSLFLKAKKIVKMGKEFKFDFGSSNNVKSVHKPLINPFNIDLSEKEDIGLSICKNVLGKGLVKSVGGNFVSRKKELFLENSLGVDSHLVNFDSIYFFQATSKKGRDLQRFFKRDYKRAGFEHLKNIPINTVSEDLVNFSTELLKAKKAKGGDRRVLCDNEMSGVFFHEAVGHGLEADHLLNDSSIFKNKLEQVVSSDMINFSDGARVKNSFGYYDFDDEGVKKKEVSLIKNGVLKGYLHSQRTSGELDLPLSGNARSMNAHNLAIPRMSVLHLKGGDYSEDELVKELKNGLLVKGFTGGEVSPHEGKFILALV